MKQKFLDAFFSWFISESIKHLFYFILFYFFVFDNEINFRLKNVITQKHEQIVLTLQRIIFQWNVIYFHFQMHKNIKFITTKRSLIKRILIICYNCFISGNSYASITSIV